MPIRLNLLAEAQAAEELRRRDPLKRSLWAAALVISLMLVWSSSISLKAMLAKGEVSRLQGQVNVRTNAYQQVLNNQKKLQEIHQKLNALHQLSTNRFLNGTLLNSLQQVFVDEVQMIHLKAEQSYAVVEGSKARTNSEEKVVAKPASSTEKIVITIDGNDSSQNPGDQVNKYREHLASQSYFKSHLAKTNGVILKNLATPQIAPGTSKPFVLFTLECRYPERTR